jgi:hypothetical protein
MAEYESIPIDDMKSIHWQGSGFMRTNGKKYFGRFDRIVLQSSLKYF